MRQIHGIADGKKVMMVGETDDVDVRIIDGVNQRILLMTNGAHVSLTPAHARYLAKCLCDAALRVTKAPAPPGKEEK